MLWTYGIHQTIYNCTTMSSTTNRANIVIENPKTLKILRSYRKYEITRLKIRKV